MVCFDACITGVFHDALIQSMFNGLWIYSHLLHDAGRHGQGQSGEPGLHAGGHEAGHIAFFESGF